MPKQSYDAPSRRMTTYRPYDSTLLTRPETALYLGVSVSALAHWACQGKGPPRAIIGHSAYYRQTDCDIWMDSRIGVRRGAK